MVEADLIILATGFDANSGGINAIDIVGVGGAKLAEKWADGIDTNKGLSTNGFPNLLFLYGPQSPSGFCNGPTSAEEQGDLVVEFLEHVRSHGYQRFEATREAEVEWTEHVDGVFQWSMFPKARSWYWGANVPGRKAQMLNHCGGLTPYFAAWEQSKANDFADYTFE